MTKRANDEGGGVRGARYVEGMLYDVAEPEPVSERTAIVCELAHRFQDLHDLDARFCFKLLHGLLRVYQNHPGTFREVLEVLAGNQKGGKSLAVIASEKAAKCSKQNIHQTEQRRFQELQQDLPEIARVLAEIRGRTIKKS